jgi:hypothetical protein
MTIKLQRAQIRIPLKSDGGPDQVTVWIEGADGKSYDFQVDVPRGMSHAYLKGLGFASAHEIATVEAEDPKARNRKVRKESRSEVTL